MATTDKRFAIAHTLLDDTMAAPAWTNLGCWQRHDGQPILDYAQAAEELAARVGARAITTPGAVVVDLGCGRGASLRFWQRAFTASNVIGIERQADCVASWQSLRQPMQSLYQGRFDQLPLPSELAQSLPESGCDAAVCVDAAYHAESVGAFIAVAQKLLRTSGRLAFTTILVPSHRTLRHRLQTRLLTQLADIPTASVVTAPQLEATLARLGFCDVQIEYLDQAVLQGYADFVERRGQQLPAATKRSTAWLKIAGTAALCRHWFHTGAMHYVLVSAQRSL